MLVSIWKKVTEVLRSIRKNFWADESRINEFGFMFLLIIKNFLEESIN